MTLFTEIKQMIKHLFGFEDVEITEDVHLQIDLGVDSIGIMNLIAAINEKYGLELLLDDVVELENIGELISLVASKIPA